MWLKIAIVVLFIATVASLSSGLYFLLNDMGSKSKRTLYALGVRVILAVLLLSCIVYGLASGQLGSTAPWDAGPTKQGQPLNTN